MALWNNVLSGFDTEDETINFGTRIIAESKTSIYETVTLATVQADGEIKSKPKIVASLQYSRLCLAVDKSITIFEDETCLNILLSIAFDSLITTYCISKDELFLYVVLNNGMLYCLHLLDNGKIIFSTNIYLLTNNQFAIKKILIQEETNKSIQLILITKNGAIYRMSLFCEEHLASIAIKNDESFFKKLKENIECTMIFKGFEQNEELSTVAIIPDNSIIFMIGKNTCLFWPSEKYCRMDTLPYKYKKAQIFKKFNAMICLRTDKLINLVCTRTLTGIKVYKEPVIDFMIIDDGSNDHQILLLLENENSEMLTLRLVSFPEFEEKFQISVPTTTNLVDILNSTSGSILFIEGILSGTDINTIRIKNIIESAPDLRLERLLKRRKFEEAEIFAKKFNLSMENIYFSRAMLLVEQLSPWTKKRSDLINFNLLINTLSQINDVQFVVNCCINAIMSDHKQMKKLLLYARQRIIDNNKDLLQNEQLNLRHINSAIHRLETFEVLYETLIVNEYTEDQTLNEWIRFSRMNLLDECKIRLSIGELEAAALIWSRHLPDIAKNVSTKTVQDILKTISDKISLTVLWPWLSHFIPSVLSLFPEVICNIIDWGCKKIKSLENFRSELWPQIGIDFATKFLTLLKFDKNPPLYFYKKHINDSSILKYFMNILQALYDIQQLKTDHKIKISINSYIGEPIDVIHFLLNKVPVEGINELVQTFLKQYILNHSLKNDLVFSSYIQKLIYNSKEWWSWEEAPWERRVITVITYIHDTQNRLKQTLEVLKKAPVPWTSTISTLAEISTKFEHPLATKIKIEHDYVPIKLILKKYGYGNIGINDKLISYIVRQNRKEMFSDIYELTKNNVLLRKKGFSFCVNYYLTRGNFEISFQILNNLDDDIVLYCCEQIVNYIISSLTFKNIPKTLEYHIESLSWVESKLQNILIKSKIQQYHYNGIIDDINTAKCLYQLKKEFHITVSRSEFYTEKHQILQTYITNLCHELNTQSLTTLIAYKKAVKLSSILKLPRLKAIFLLLSGTKNFDILKHLTGFEGTNVDVTADECKYVNDICKLMLQNVKVTTETIHVIKGLCASALNCCYDGEIEDILKSYNWVNLYAQSLAKYRTNTIDINSGEKYKTQWKLYTIYKDLAISLDPLLLTVLETVLFIAIAYTDSPNTCHLRKTVEENRIQDQKMIEALLDNLLMKIKEMNFIHNEYGTLQIVKMLYFSYCFSLRSEQRVLNEIKSLLSQILITLLKRVVSTQKFDLQFGLSCLFMLPDQEAHNWLSTTSKLFQTDYARHAMVSLLGYEYFRFQRNELLMQSFDFYNMLHYWAQKLSTYSVTYKEIFTSNNTEKIQMLKHVMNHNDDNVIPLLQDFCNSFGFDIDDCLMLYLHVLLNAWNPTLNISSSNGKKELQIAQEEINKLRTNCIAVIAKIANKTTLKQYARSIWSEINFYHYEAFIILMDLVGIGTLDTRNYLYFLQNYTRCGHPTQIEEEEWMRFCAEHRSLPAIAEHRSLPAIAEHRLPFLPKIEIWKLITPELNLKTYEKWLTIASILKVEPHILCSVAIKEEVIQEWGPLNTKRKANEWSLYPRNNILLENVLKCIKRMTGPNAPYYATAALYYVVNYTPPGADQVAAIQQCFTYAEMAVKQSTSFEEGLLEKIQFKYLRFTAEHILRTHGLGTDTYTSLITNPSELVHALYMDESIPLRYRSAINLRPDINSAVDALCNLFSLNLVKLRLQLLREWLQPDSKHMKLDHSFTDILSNVANPDVNTIYDDNICRACYILQHGDVNSLVYFLIDIGFGEDNEDDYNSEMRYRALDVLQSIIDPVTLQELTKRDIPSIRQYTKTLKYLGKLEALGLGYNMTTFEASIKYELVLILLNTQYYSPQALTLIVEICIDYNIDDYSIWDRSLTQMAKLVMVNELMEILPQLRNLSVVITCKGYAIAWQVVITQPFSKMDILPSVEQIDACITALCLLYSCPVTYELKFNDILDHCLQCQQPHLAAAFLPYLDSVDKNKIFNHIQSICKVQNVINDLNDLSSKGVLGIPYCITILQQNVETANL
ncbi:hypothetical protein KPH14_012521 [Odynerus spinipes]|uniref:Kinetochore-associated protein 1 n=1 Tax=Odynerus spinipes TaxID=1348599 RepID=A0AAD9RIA4_9HYME|nr:hypothetical protein KPH14_012521 [Odynerus spinipes]